MDLRTMVIAAMRAKGWSAYKLGQESGVPIRTVQKFVQGVSDIHSDGLGLLLDALELELRPRRGGRKGEK